MHPVIRVICFLILSGFVVFGSVYELALGLLIVAVVVLIKRLQSLEISLRIIKRMKWFFLSILIVYLWFTPGTPLLNMNIPGMPTLEGVRTGLLRVTSLVLIIFAVNYFITTIARTKLVEAIIWLLSPIRLIGVDNGTVAVRIALVLELIPKVQHIVLDVKQNYLHADKVDSSNMRAARKNIIIAKLSAASGIVERLFVRVVDEAINMPQEKIELAPTSGPPVVQWCVPLAMLGLFLWVKTL